MVRSVSSHYIHATSITAKQSCTNIIIHTCYQRFLCFLAEKKRLAIHAMGQSWHQTLTRNGGGKTDHAEIFQEPRVKQIISGDLALKCQITWTAAADQVTKDVRHLHCRSLQHPRHWNSVKTTSLSRLPCSSSSSSCPSFVFSSANLSSYVLHVSPADSLWLDIYTWQGFIYPSHRGIHPLNFFDTLWHRTPTVGSVKCMLFLSTAGYCSSLN